MSKRYYVDQDPLVLLCGVGSRHEKFLDGRWQPTKLKSSSTQLGHNDFVDPISEAEARKLAPDPFRATKTA
jgi:hypothetical protein